VEPYGFSADMPFYEQMFHSLFLSVTARTAGFNTVPIESLAAPALMAMIMLMWIGAAPGSTGGGIKTTTFSLSFLSLINLASGKKQLQLFNRRIAPESIHRASMVIIASLIALFIGSFVLIIAEPGKDPMDLIFEATSAISTVGLSRGITADLSWFGKLVVILLMFIGRIGVLAFFLSFHKTSEPPRYELPKEDVLVG
jgi:Trk-type K+ transport system membrane component